MDHPSGSYASSFASRGRDDPKNRVLRPTPMGHQPRKLPQRADHHCRVDVGDDCVTLKSGLTRQGGDMGGGLMKRTSPRQLLDAPRQRRGEASAARVQAGVSKTSLSRNAFSKGRTTAYDQSSEPRRPWSREDCLENRHADVPHPFINTNFYQRPPTKPGDSCSRGRRAAALPGTSSFFNITARGGKDAGSITGRERCRLRTATIQQCFTSGRQRVYTARKRQGTGLLSRC